MTLRVWRDQPDPPLGPFPGTATTWSVLRFLSGGQRGAAALGAVFAIGWMGSWAAAPAVLGLVIDHGLAGDGRALVGSRALDPCGGLEKVPAGEVVSRAISEAHLIGQLVTTFCCRGVGAVVSFLAVAVVMVVTSPLLGGIVLAGLPPVLVAMTPLWRPLERRSRREQQRIARGAAVAGDTIVGLRVLKGLRAEDAAIESFTERNAEMRSSAVHVARFSAWWAALGVLIPGVFLVVVAWVGGHLAVSGRWPRPPGCWCYPSRPPPLMPTPRRASSTSCWQRAGLAARSC